MAVPVSRRSPSRRPSLSPSTVSPPSLTAQTCAIALSSRDHSLESSSPRALALLARVASRPARTKSSSTITTPNRSPLERSQTSPHLPIDHTAFIAAAQAMVEKVAYNAHEGYISFPDFERFCESQAASAGQDRP
ncbi:MAG: hypothetical protein M1829_005923 [Trizodia sp. TS-e1964]|nr:MAG: hypothetical protein M1829_005923 [Trizodia sp. TS-e1964]